MRFAVHMSRPDENRLMAEALARWASFARLPLETEELEAGRVPEGPAALLWDLDCGMPPPFSNRSPDGYILLLCASEPRMSIDSYAMHPAGFLKKPMTVGQLRGVLDRFAGDWWDEFERVDVVYGGLHRRIPLYELLWVESSQHGTLLHTRRERIQMRESLGNLGARLPDKVFCRCQRSFLVNLYHVRSAASDHLVLDDSTQIPVGHRIRDEVQEACRRLEAMWGTSVL